MLILKKIFNYTFNYLEAMKLLKNFNFIFNNNEKISN